MIYKVLRFSNVFSLLISVAVLMFFVSVVNLLQWNAEKLFATPSSKAQPPQLTCLLDADRALDELRVPWFITFGSALSYHRNRSFDADDIDTGIFFHDIMPIGNRLVVTFKQHGFRLFSNYGSLTDGQEWRFGCPSMDIRLDIFVFYPPLSTDPKSPSFRWWAASYNGFCNDMRYKKCRFRFSAFTPELYGRDWKTPKNYTYLESLNVLPNLIRE